MVGAAHHGGVGTTHTITARRTRIAMGAKRPRGTHCTRAKKGVGKWSQQLAAYVEC